MNRSNTTYGVMILLDTLYIIFYAVVNHAFNRLTEGKSMSRIKRTLLQRLEAKGMDPCLIPGFIRCLANALCAAPPGDLFQINKQLQYLGWDAFELDYHTLELAAACLETDGLEAHAYKPANWFEARFNPRKAA